MDGTTGNAGEVLFLFDFIFASSSSSLLLSAIALPDGRTDGESERDAAGQNEKNRTGALQFGWTEQQQQQWKLGEKGRRTIQLLECILERVLD